MYMYMYIYAAVCFQELCPRFPSLGRCLSGGNIVLAVGFPACRAPLRCLAGALCGSG